MKTQLSHAFRGAKKQLVIATSLVISATAFAQTSVKQEQGENSQVPWSNTHFIYEEQPNLAVYTSPEAAAAMPSALATDNTAASDLNDVVTAANIPATRGMAGVRDVSVCNHATDNHLLIMAVNTQRKNVTASVHDLNGTRVMFEIPIDAGSYRMVEHTRNLAPGIYVLHVMEKGVLLGKEKFEVR